MAVQYETLENNLVKSYSDSGFLIHGGYPEGDYVEAIDPVDAHREYTETDIPVVDPESEAKIEDYIKALQDLGVNING